MNWAKIITLLALSVVASAQIQQTPPPQTARQAVLEILLGKTPNAVQKHLPENAIDIFGKTDSGLLSMFNQQISSIQHQALSGDKNIETFDVGPFLLVSETTEGKQRVRTEIAVDRDDLSGDEDQIELSLHMYKDGIVDKLPIVPNLIIDMKEEKDIWRLTQLTLAVHVPLSDSDYVQGIAEDMRKTRQRMVEYGAVSALNVLKGAELARQKKGLPYTCTVGDVGKGLERGENDSESRFERMQIKDDYVFKIIDCSASLHIVAEPVKDRAARRAFCIDEAGAVLFSDDGKGSSCISGGRPLQEMEESGGGRSIGVRTID